MQNLIKVKNASYERYEELLLKKEALKKEAEEYRNQYDKVFGGLNTETYEARMDCVKKRKIISYCQSMLSLGETVQKKQLDEFIEKAMKDYKDTLAYLLDGDKQEQESSSKNTNQSKQIKTIYRQLAKLIHPDVNSKIKDDKTIQDLWNRTCIAYNCSNEEELQELEILINRYLDSINHSHYDVEIPNVEEKIFNLNREIEKIIHTNPYQYKYILNDEENFAKKKDELIKELNDYRRYVSELDKQIELFEIIQTE